MKKLSVDEMKQVKGGIPCDRGMTCMGGMCGFLIEDEYGARFYQIVGWDC